MAKESIDWWEEYWQQNGPDLPSTLPPIPEKWSGYQINFGDLITQLFGEYEDSSAGILTAQGKSIEREVARLLDLGGKNKRTTLTNHHLAGQATFGQIFYDTKETYQVTIMDAPEIIAKLITDSDSLNNPRWQQEICLDVYSDTGVHAGFFGRKFDLVTKGGIFEIKTRLPKNQERILIDLAIMAICWPVLKHGLVETIVSPWKKLRTLKPGRHNSFEKITPKIGPVFAMVGSDGIITGEDVGLNMRLVKEYQHKIYDTLLEMLAC